LLGSKGELRPYLLNKDIQALNNYMQKYIHCFFRNTNVELKLNGASIDIKIDSLGVKKTVSRLSGGEKKRLDIAIQFALYDLLQSTSQIRFNLVCFDEIEAELDEVGIQQIIDMVEDKSSEIESVFWITNNSMVSESIPNKIICKKTLGVTTLEEV
jgi:DNA repair exonuclease SbcCD ATPase subunit